MSTQQPGLQGIPATLKITDSNGILTPQWTAYLSQLDFYCSGIGNAGTTATRPTNVNNQLFKGYGFFDTTLGYMVWVKTINPLVWVNGAGTPV